MGHGGQTRRKLHASLKPTLSPMLLFSSRLKYWALGCIENFRSRWAFHTRFYIHFSVQIEILINIGDLPTSHGGLLRMACQRWSDNRSTRVFWDQGAIWSISRVYPCIVSIPSMGAHGPHGGLLGADFIFSTQYTFTTRHKVKMKSNLAGLNFFKILP